MCMCVYVHLYNNWWDCLHNISSAELFSGEKGIAPATNHHYRQHRIPLIFCLSGDTDVCLLQSHFLLFPYNRQQTRTGKWQERERERKESNRKLGVIIMIAVYRHYYETSGKMVMMRMTMIISISNNRGGKDHSLGSSENWEKEWHLFIIVAHKNKQRNKPVLIMSNNNNSNVI